MLNGFLFGMGFAFGVIVALAAIAFFVVVVWAGLQPRHYKWAECPICKGNRYDCHCKE